MDRREKVREILRQIRGLRGCEIWDEDYFVARIEKVYKRRKT